MGTVIETDEKGKKTTRTQTPAELQEIADRQLTGAEVWKREMEATDNKMARAREDLIQHKIEYHGFIVAGIEGDIYNAKLLKRQEGKNKGYIH